MTSIIFLIETIWHNQYRFSCIRNKNVLLQFFLAYLKSILKFEHFQKQDDSHSWCISENMDSEKRGYINVWEELFHRAPQQATNEQVKTLLQSER